MYRLGPRTVDVKKLLSVLSMSSGATAYYTAENAAIPVSEPTFAEGALLAPKELTALVPVSNRLLRVANRRSYRGQAPRLPTGCIRKRGPCWRHELVRQGRKSHLGTSSPSA